VPITALKMVISYQLSVISYGVIKFEPGAVPLALIILTEGANRFVRQ